jgi:hypothetical protein
MSRARSAALLALSALAGARAQNAFNAGPVWRYDPTVMAATSGACAAFAARESQARVQPSHLAASTPRRRRTVVRLGLLRACRARSATQAGLGCASASRRIAACPVRPSGA